jgi:hypothetical protein
MENLYKIGSLRITTPNDWLDVTQKVEERNPPFTLARPDGVGAIQFSIAEYHSGRVPKITLDGLRQFLTDFAQSRELGPGYGFASQENILSLAAASFDFEDRFLRVWYCSDGQNVVLVTYNCERGQQQAELSDCESIVRSLKFGT